MIYRENRHYRGDTKQQTENFRQHGADPKNKDHEQIQNNINKAAAEGQFDGCQPEDLQGFAKTASEHSYFTKQKEGDENYMGAEDYAKLNASKDNPAHVTRAFLPKSAVKLEEDPDSVGDAGKNLATRTKDAVPAGLFLPSHADGPKISLASEHFKDQFNNNTGARKALKIDTTISSNQAAQMLHGEQTPSPTDFKERAPWE